MDSLDFLLFNSDPRALFVGVIILIIIGIIILATRKNNFTGECSDIIYTLPESYKPKYYEQVTRQWLNQPKCDDGQWFNPAAEQCQDPPWR